MTLARVVDTTDEWIVARTGIRQRHVAGEQESDRHPGRSALRAQALLVADLAPRSLIS